MVTFTSHKIHHLIILKCTIQRHLRHGTTVSTVKFPNFFITPNRSPASDPRPLPRPGDRTPTIAATLPARDAWHRCSRTARGSRVRLPHRARRLRGRPLKRGSGFIAHGRSHVWRVASPRPGGCEWHCGGRPRAGNERPVPVLLRVDLREASLGHVATLRLTLRNR